MSESLPTDLDQDAIEKEGLVSAAMWATTNMHTPDISEEDAPSGIAYSYWKWGQDPKEHTQCLKTLAQIMLKGGMSEDRQELEDDGRTQLKRLRKLVTKCPHCGEEIQ